MAPYTDDSIELVSDHQKAAIELLSEGTHDELIRSRLAILDFIADKDAEIAALKAAAQQALDAFDAVMDADLGWADKLIAASRARTAIAQAVKP